nr:alanine--tRNA ligase-related protein [uncultured Butyrivibrio sp.]
MNSSIQLKKKYIDYFVSKGHKQIDSSSVVPDNDPSCLFNTAGMQPLVPFLLGNPHPRGKRLVDYQKCFRLTDLESVGDKTHHTFFEMLGNWSLGDYFKQDAIKWSFEFLTKVLAIPTSYLSVTVFEGNEVVPRDIEAANCWLELGISPNHIAYLPAENNWWPSLDQYGPCGSDTEIFYWSDTTETPPERFDPDDDRWVEIWNNVFMQFEHKTTGEFVELKQKNVDTGMGVERATAALPVNANTALVMSITLVIKFPQLSILEYRRIIKKITGT